MARSTTLLKVAGFCCAVAIAGIVFAYLPSQAQEAAVEIPKPALDAAETGLQKAVIAGGCFWGIQAVYQHTEGVTNAVSGYSGGTKATASYEVVSSGTTKHAEAVEITYDPKKISYGRILQIYFSVAHNPTQLNYQGPDHGPQYRSNIFYSNAEQKKVAEAYIAQLGKLGIFKQPIVTRVDQLEAFYPAEAYHQDYALKHPNNPYIAYNDAPKVENLKRLLPDVYREQPVTVASAAK